MFDRFTTEAKDLMNRARQECVRLHHEYLGPEHIFLAMLGMPESTGVAILRECGLAAQDLLADVERVVKPGSERLTVGQIPFTPGAKKVLELTMTEASQARHETLTVGDVLLGLACVDGSIPARILADRGLRIELLRMKAGARTIGVPWDRPPMDGGRRRQVLGEALGLLEVLGETEAADRVRDALNRLA
jgi:ATP-dependent Clp protease ATP-binding subunit ClpC